jgi:hypothetical protein
VPEPAVGKKFPVAIWAGAAAVVVAMIAGGVMIYRNASKDSETPAVATVVVPPPPPSIEETGEMTQQPAVEGAPAAEPEAAVASVPAEAPSGAIESPPPAPAVAVLEPKPSAAPSQPAAPAGMDSVVQAILAEGKACMAKKQYDCAIASAKSALRVAPGNADALALQTQARAAQQKALSSIRIE